ncbi:MAG TPA: hypothetical protein VGO43_12620 [Pyrinomonadaceae bacterium]|jgi:hypothetical protein|nr:hypothetical protein [Pyrinomonadaceae bacterium]
MPTPNLDFEFYAGGIEDGILQALTIPLKAIGARSFATYSGQLNSPEDLKRAIGSQTLQFPFVMVSYAGGESKRVPPTPPVLGRPLYYRHDCSFAVIVADNNPQGERARRRGPVYKMIASVWDTLTGVRLKKVVDGVDEPILLNAQVLEPIENIQIQLPDITAYGIVIDTSFDWISPDRTTAGTPVTDLILGVGSTNPDVSPETPTTPGTSFGGS